MKKLSLLSVLVLVAAMLYAAPLSSSTLVGAPVATVNLIRNTPISQSDLDAEYQMYVDSGVTGITKSQVLDIMINDEVFLQGAERDGINITDNEVNQYVAQMKQQLEASAGQSLTDEQFSDILLSQVGMTLDEYRQSLKEQLIVNNYLMMKKGTSIQQNIKVPTESEISSFYRNNKQSFYSPENVKLSHVFIEKTGDEAKDSENAKLLMNVAEDIKNGKMTFEKAVQQYSTDEESKKVGGDIGWLTIDNTVARQGFGDAFCDAVLNMDTGEISGMLESNVGYHIVKVTLHSEGKILGLDETISPEDTMTVHDYIYQMLLVQNQNIAMQNALNELIQELRNQARINIYYKD